MNDKHFYTKHTTLQFTYAKKNCSSLLENKTLQTLELGDFLNQLTTAP